MIIFILIALHYICNNDTEIVFNKVLRWKYIVLLINVNIKLLLMVILLAFKSCRNLYILCLVIYYQLNFKINQVKFIK